MNALLLINQNGGNGNIVKNINKIISSLRHKFERVDYFICDLEEDFIRHCKKACGNYDALIFAGGDGTFHLVVNALATEENVPILGVLPSGTLCDAAKNFGVSKNINKALKIIDEENIRDFDIVKFDDEYFVFEASFGVYSDIPYSVTQKTKKKLGHFAYYFKALPEMFKKSKIQMRLTLDGGKQLYVQTPFLLVMNSSYMAGFKINKDSDISDGLMDIFYSKCEPFNGLFSYFFFKKRVCHYQSKSLKVEVFDNGHWDIDGEKAKKGNVLLNVIPNRFKMFYKNKNN